MNTLNPNTWCKVKINDDFDLTYVRRENQVMAVISLISISEENVKIYTDFRYWEDDYWIINGKKRVFNNYGLAYDTHINNLNSSMRRRLRLLKKQMDEFKAKQFSCDGCIYKNNYLLTNQCDKYYTTKDEAC